MNSIQQYQLHWRDHSPNFVSVFTQMLQSEHLVDVTLAADGKQLHAHRVVLSACSSYFQDLFVSHPCQHPIVILKDVKFEDLRTIIRFMYYGEVNVSQEHMNSILKTAEILQVKGLTNVSEREPPTMTKYIISPSPSPSEIKVEEVDYRPRKRRRDSIHIQSKSMEEHPQPSPQSRQDLYVCEERTTFRSSLESTVIKEQSSVVEQSSTETQSESFCKEDQEDLTVPTNGQTGNTWSTTQTTNGSSSTDSGVSKSKQKRALFRQERINRKDAEKDQPVTMETERCSPIPSTLQPILPKSPASSEPEENRSRTQKYLQLPQLPKQKSQPILPSQTSILSSSSSVSSSSVQPIGFLPTSIPTVAVTSVSSTPNIVIEQYPILRIVSVDEMNSASTIQTSTTPSLVRTISQPGTTVKSQATLQVPGSMDGTGDSNSQGFYRLKQARLEENLRRSVSTPGISPTSSAAASSSSSSSTGHCPVLRQGAALGCNYCWNTVDNHGRILRRKTKYHCPECQANLCIVPCFQEYHEKFVSSSDSVSSSKGQPNPHQMLSKMSSI